MLRIVSPSGKHVTVFEDEPARSWRISSTPPRRIKIGLPNVTRMTLNKRLVTHAALS